jgi:hypothetical protein
MTNTTPVRCWGDQGGREQHKDDDDELPETHDARAEELTDTADVHHEDNREEALAEAQRPIDVNDAGEPEEHSSGPLDEGEDEKEEENGGDEEESAVVEENGAKASTTGDVTSETSTSKGEESIAWK